MDLTKSKYYIFTIALILGLTSIVFADNHLTKTSDADRLEDIIDSVATARHQRASEKVVKDTVSQSEVNDTTAESAANGEPTGVIDDEEIVITDKNGHEEIIEVPEGLITDENSDTLDFLGKKYLSEDSTSLDHGNLPTYEDSIYMDRLKRMPTAIEMPWNPTVQKFIDRYTGRLRHTVSFMLGAQNFYMPIFEQALETYDIPLELKYLPVIESALKPSATSNVGAAGLWQFMIGTGKTYGLKVNSLIDERRDPVKASYAAAHYLSDMYKIFHNWNLVIAAYNCGPGNIQKAIKRSGGKHDFWEIYPYLPAETRGYVPAFIAANYIMNYYCEHNIKPMTAKLPEQTDTIMLFQDLHFKQVSDVIGISMDELRALNPQYRRDIVCGYSEPTDLRLPKEYIDKYLDKEKEILSYDVSDLMNRDQVDVNEVASGHHYYHKSRHRDYSDRHSGHHSKKDKKHKKDKKKHKEKKKKHKKRKH